MNGEKQDEESAGGLVRLQAVRLLSQMNPSQALNVRALCVEQCVMPGLTVYVTLDADKVNSAMSTESSRVNANSGAVKDSPVTSVCRSVFAYLLYEVFNI